LFPRPVLRSSLVRTGAVAVFAVGLIAATGAGAAASTSSSSRISSEVACQSHLSTPGYFSSLNGAEVADAARSQLYPCADFLGSWTAPNTVAVTASKGSYQGATFINSRKPGELYLVGGDSPPTTGTVPPGPYVAKVNSKTGAQIWRTVLDNANGTGRWIATSNLNILADGNIVEAWSHFVAILDADTGRVIKRRSLGAGPAGPDDGNFKHVTVAPDGTLIIKQQNRVYGCTTQSSVALLMCPGTSSGPPRQANSMMVAVDPITLKVLDTALLPENMGTPHTITQFHGKTAIYMVGSNAGLSKLYRYFWNPKTKRFSQDTAFVVSILAPGQTSGDAPGILGNWIVTQTNGDFSSVASSIVAVNQDNPALVTSINPFGPLPRGEQSFAPPKAAVDAPNNMVYSADQGVGMVAGIKFNRQTGAMENAWVINDKTTCLVALYGPKNKRVVGVSKYNPEATAEQLQNGTYTEQATWRDAATGNLLAESPFFSAMAANTLITPGFGGDFYFATNTGFMILTPKLAT